MSRGLLITSHLETYPGLREDIEQWLKYLGHRILSVGHLDDLRTSRIDLSNYDFIIAELNNINGYGNDLIKLFPEGVPIFTYAATSPVDGEVLTRAKSFIRIDPADRHALKAAISRTLRNAGFCTVGGGGQVTHLGRLIRETGIGSMQPSKVSPPPDPILAAASITRPHCLPQKQPQATGRPKTPIRNIIPDLLGAEILKRKKSAESEEPLPEGGSSPVTRAYLKAIAFRRLDKRRP